MQAQVLHEVVAKQYQSAYLLVNPWIFLLCTNLNAEKINYGREYEFCFDFNQKLCDIEQVACEEDELESVKAIRVLFELLVDQHGEAKHKAEKAYGCAR